MKIEFFKMQAAGNDYIYVDARKTYVPHPEKLAKSASIRRFSIGSDGLVLILPSNAADVKMRIFNADGSEGEICGNALRCVGKYVAETENKKELTVETKAGIKKLTPRFKGAKVTSVAVRMGKADFSPSSIPVLSDSAVIGRPYAIGEKTFFLTCVSIGNPHAVFIVDDLAGLDVERLGRIVENDVTFPMKTNVEFVRKTSAKSLRARVWERGSGMTLSCGSGACAVAAACAVNGLIAYDTPVVVTLDGGEMTVTVGKDLSLELTGDCRFVYKGEYDYAEV